MLNKHLSEFFKINFEAFESSLEARDINVIAKEIGFVPQLSDFSSELFNDPLTLFKTLICIGYPNFEESVDFSSLEYLIESEYKCLILELFCKLNCDIPQSLKDEIKAQLDNQLKKFNWSSLNIYDILQWDSANSSYKIFSLLVTFSIKYFPEKNEELVNTPNFQSFLLSLIEDENDSLAAELYLIIMNILVDYNYQLYLNCWVRNENRLIHSLIRKINSRQSLKNLMTILTKHDCSEAIDQEIDHNFIKKLWDFMLDTNNEYDNGTFLKLCSKFSIFTVCCFDLFIEYYLENQSNCAEKIMSALKLYQQLMLIVGTSTSAPQFHKIIRNLYCSGSYIQTAIIEFIDDQLKSQLYLEEFLNCYFELISSYLEDKKLIENQIKQFIIYTLTDDSRNQSQRENLFKSYLCNLIQFFKQIPLSDTEPGSYSMMIKKIYRYIPSMQSYILELAEKELKEFNGNRRFQYLLYCLTDYEESNKSSKIPHDILEIMELIINCLIDIDNDECKSILFEKKNSFIDQEMEDYNYEFITYEYIKHPGKLEYWIKGVLLKKGIPNILNGTLSSKDAKLIKQILEKAKTSFSFETIFNQNIPIPIRLYFASHFTNLISMKIHHGMHDNILKLGNMYAAQMIDNFCEPIDANDKVLLLSIVKSKVALKAFKEHGYDLAKAIGFEEKTFYIDLPLKIHSVTVLGGVILLNSITRQNRTLYKCIKIIAYLHELAHALRKCKSGSYSILEHTPESSQDYYEGPSMADGIDDAKKEAAKQEGGMQIESILFGKILNQVNDEQIEFIIDKKNWNMTLRKFKSELERLNSCSSTYYHLGREQYYSIDRLPHVNTSFWKD